MPNIRLAAQQHRAPILNNPRIRKPLTGAALQARRLRLSGNRQHTTRIRPAVLRDEAEGGKREGSGSQDVGEG